MGIRSKLKKAAGALTPDFIEPGSGAADAAGKAARVAQRKTAAGFTAAGEYYKKRGSEISKEYGGARHGYSGNILGFIDRAAGESLSNVGAGIANPSNKKKLGMAAFEVATLLPVTKPIGMGVKAARGFRMVDFAGDVGGRRALVRAGEAGFARAAKKKAPRAAKEVAAKALQKGEVDAAQAAAQADMAALAEKGQRVLGLRNARFWAEKKADGLYLNDQRLADVITGKTRIPGFSTEIAASDEAVSALRIVRSGKAAKVFFGGVPDKVATAAVSVPSHLGGGVAEIPAAAAKSAPAAAKAVVAPAAETAAKPAFTAKKLARQGFYDETHKPGKVKHIKGGVAALSDEKPGIAAGDAAAKELLERQRNLPVPAKIQATSDLAAPLGSLFADNAAKLQATKASIAKAAATGEANQLAKAAGVAQRAVAKKVAAPAGRKPLAQRLGVVDDELDDEAVARRVKATMESLKAGKAPAAAGAAPKASFTVKKTTTAKATAPAKATSEGTSAATTRTLREAVRESMGSNSARGWSSQLARDYGVGRSRVANILKQERARAEKAGQVAARAVSKKAAPAAAQAPAAAAPKVTQVAATEAVQAPVAAAATNQTAKKLAKRAIKKAKDKAVPAAKQAVDTAASSAKDAPADAAKASSGLLGKAGKFALRATLLKPFPKKTVALFGGTAAVSAALSNRDLVGFGGNKAPKTEEDVFLAGLPEDLRKDVKALLEVKKKKGDAGLKALVEGLGHAEAKGYKAPTDNKIGNLMENNRNKKLLRKSVTQAHQRILQYDAN